MIILLLVCVSLLSIVTHSNRDNKSLKFIVLFSMCLATCGLVLTRFSSYSYAYESFQRDLISLSLLCITSLLLLVSPLTINFSSKTLPSLYITLLLLGLASYVIFSTTHIILIYVSYEASLLPILYCILKWGVYPERSLRALIILLFTSFFTFPLVILLFLSSPFTYRILPFIADTHLSLGGSLWVIISFAVKLPVFGLHYWLPIAHVEAPTFGSMILAGVLLKIGGCGLIRLCPLFYNQLYSISQFTRVFFIIGSIISSILCCIQSDFKRLVAYSSVSHITLVFLLILSPTPISSLSLIILIVFHGISSPLLFFGVGLARTILSTREIVLFRGFQILRPLISLYILLSFLIAIPVPPLPSFLAELLVFYRFFNLSALSSPFIFSLVLLSLLYSLLWFSSIMGKIVPKTGTITTITQYIIPLSLTFTAFSVMPLLLL